MDEEHDTTPLNHSVCSDTQIQDDHISSTRKSLWRRITVEPALLLYLLYSSGMSPVQEQYIYYRISQNMNMTLHNITTSVCHINQSDPYYLKQQSVQSETSTWMIYFNICLMVPALISTVFIGGYSDQHGRKVGLILPVTGAIMALYILLCIEIFQLPLWWILIAASFEGICGGSAMFLMASFSYISDVSSHRQRSLRIIILEVVIGCSSTVSFIVSGYMIQTLGYLGTTIVLHMIIFLNLYVVLFLPESIPTNQHSSIHIRKYFMKVVDVYITDDGMGRRTALLMSLLMLFFLTPARLGTGSVQILFMLDTPLCWTSTYIGYFKGLYYLTTSIGSILLTKFAQPRCGDLFLLIIGCISAVMHLIFWAFIKTSLLMILVPILGIFCTLPIGMVRAFASKLVSSHEQGAMFSMIASMEQIGVITGSVIFSTVYRSTLLWFNGFVFIVIACVYFCAGIIAVALLMKRNLSQQAITN